MNKEEIKVMIKDCVYSEDGITYMSDKQYNNYINIIEKLQQENQKYKEVIDKAIEYIEKCLKQTPIENRTKTDDTLDIEYEYILKILKEVK